MTIQARDASKLKAEQTVYGWQFEQMSCNPRPRPTLKSNRKGRSTEDRPFRCNSKLRSLEDLNVLCLPALRTLDDIELNRLAFLK
jgi:hypothetical protein